MGREPTSFATMGWPARTETLGMLSLLAILVWITDGEGGAVWGLGWSAVLGRGDFFGDGKGGGRADHVTPPGREGRVRGVRGVRGVIETRPFMEKGLLRQTKLWNNIASHHSRDGSLN